MNIDHKSYNLPGVLLSVSRAKGEIQHFTSGYSNAKDKTLIEPKMMLRCGCITRLFTMSILMRFVDKYALDLDTPLELIASQHRQDGGLLKILVSQYAFLKPVSIRELLSDTSGLPAVDKTLAYNRIFLTKPRKIWQLENYLDAITGADVQYLGGNQNLRRGQYNKSNTNYIIAGLVIEAVSGIKTSEVMDDLFREFGLDSTYYFPYGRIEKKLTANMIHGYLPASHPFASAFLGLPTLTYNDNRELQVYDVTTAYSLNGMANAAAVSTTTDLIRWLRLLVEGKVVVGNYSQLFSSASTAPTVQDGEDYYCLGFYKSVLKKYGQIIWTTGNSLGYPTLLAHSLDQDVTFILTVNVNRQFFSLHTDGLVENVLESVLGGSEQ